MSTSFETKDCDLDCGLYLATPATPIFGDSLGEAVGLTVVFISSLPDGRASQLKWPCAESFDLLPGSVLLRTAFPLSFRLGGGGAGLLGVIGESSDALESMLSSSIAPCRPGIRGGGKEVQLPDKRSSTKFPWTLDVHPA